MIALTRITCALSDTHYQTVNEVHEVMGGSKSNVRRCLKQMVYLGMATKRHIKVGTTREGKAIKVQAFRGKQIKLPF